ncbi:hypothetical protein [Streptomyces sp. NPDC051014]|uniref:hypothetical protein n=1 Tax=Streptomyces sp. NPDC051014 TaxID=3155751 RepID=UPI003400DB89
MAAIELAGTYVMQGNTNGNWVSGRHAVLYTHGIDPCVAVCGFNGSVAFMIHSDSMRTSGVGSTELADGIRALVPAMGDGAGWELTLAGGSSARVAAYLAEHFPSADIYDRGWSESAYITGDGIFASTKGDLARSLGSIAVTIAGPL